MEFEFTALVWTWRGPAPFFFVTVPAEVAKQLKDLERLVTYGWGMIPATVTIGRTRWTTALWPKDGAYVVPLKTAVRRAEQIEEDDSVTLSLRIDLEAKN